MPTCYEHPDRECYVRCQRCDRPICEECQKPASLVGVRCPSCPGARGLASTLLVALNTAVWLAPALIDTSGTRLAERIALIPAGQCEVGEELIEPNFGNEQACTAAGGTWTAGVADGAWWQLGSHAWAHWSLAHLVSNMFLLWVVGPQLELALGRVRFLGVYLLSALSGSVLITWWSAPYSMSVGASGAVFGVVGALTVVAWEKGAEVTHLGVLLLMMGVASVLVSGVSWQGHLGGLAGGTLAAAALVYAPQHRRVAWQTIGLIGLAILLIAAAAAHQL